MNTFLIMLWQTIQREARSKTLVLVFALTLVILTLINFFLNFLKEQLLATMALGAVGENTLIFFFLGIHYWSVFLCAMFACNSMRADQECGVQSQLLALPLGRLEYFSARLLGTWCLVMGYYIASLFLAFISLALVSPEAMGLTMDRIPHLIQALLSTAPATLGVILFGMLFSLYLPKLLSLVATMLLVLFIGISQSINWSLLKSGPIGVLEILGAAIHYLLPRTSLWNDVARSILMEQPLTLVWGLEIAHFILSFGLCFGIGFFLFRRQDL